MSFGGVFGTVKKKLEETDKALSETVKLILYVPTFVGLFGLTSIMN